MSEFEFKVTRDGAIARVDLSRPEEGNALTRYQTKLGQLTPDMAG